MPVERARFFVAHRPECEDSGIVLRGAAGRVWVRRLPPLRPVLRAVGWSNARVARRNRVGSAKYELAGTARAPRGWVPETRRAPALARGRALHLPLRRDFAFGRAPAGTWSGTRAAGERSQTRISSESAIPRQNRNTRSRCPREAVGRAAAPLELRVTQLLAGRIEGGTTPLTPRRLPPEEQRRPPAARGGGSRRWPAAEGADRRPRCGTSPAGAARSGSAAARPC